MQYDENAEKYGYEGEMTPLKCDELESYKGDVTIPVYGTIADAEVYLKKDVDAAIAELKQKLENVNELLKASKELLQEWADNASKQIRRLKRALWLKRADDAKHLVTAYENYDYLDCQKMTIKQETARTWMTCKLRTAEEWVKVWKNIERKCRAKSEEYK